MNKAPDHLQEYTTTQFDPEPVAYFRENKTWFEGLMWKAQLRYNGHSEFHVFYSGEKYEDGLVATDNDKPLVIWAQPVGGTERIVLFDERVHGFSAILVEQKEYAEPSIQQYTDADQKETFRIFLWTNSSIDFEDEFATDGQGAIETLEGKYESIETLQRNAYDYIGILLQNDAGADTRIVDMELA